MQEKKLLYVYDLASQTEYRSVLRRENHRKTLSLSEMRFENWLSGHLPILFLLSSILLLCPNIVTADSVEFENTAQVAPACSTQPSTFIDYNLLPADAEKVSVLLKPTDASGKLCVLYRKNGDDGDESYIPVGRSYDGYDWEASAGREANLDYLCGVHENLFGTDRLCQVRLPIHRPDDYYLASYEHSLSPRDEVARFLERTTFGPTREELNNFTSPSFENFANHVYDQIYSVPLSSHRAYYRKRANSKSTETYRQSEAGPAPCEKFSRWRRYAFTQLDAFYSQEKPNTEFPPPQHTMDVQTVVNGSDTGYVLSYAGHVRTVLTEPLKLRDDPTTTLDMQSVSYKILRADEIQGSARTFPDEFKLEYNSQQAQVEGGPPSVNLDPRFVNISSLYILDLSFLNSTQLQVISEGTTNGGNLLLTEEINNPICDSLPNPYDNDSRNQEESSRFNPDPPVFALLPDGGYAIHDKRFLLYENSLDNPLPDGGGFSTKRSVMNKPVFSMKPRPNPNQDSMLYGGQQITYCANSASTFVNEKNCYVSYNENTCIRPSGQVGSFRATTRSFDTFVKVSINNETLNSFFNLTGRHVYAIDNLRFDENNTGTVDKPVTFPCSSNARSRWVRASDDECNNATTIHSSTTEAFSHKLRTSNDVNPNLRDVIMWDSPGTSSKMCHATDAQAVGMTVWISEDAECWRNVHPDHLSVYDLTSYRYSDNTDGPFPVDQITASGTLSFDNSMGVWETWIRDKFNDQPNTDRYVGRMGDTSDASQLIKNTLLFSELKKAHNATYSRQMNDQAVVAVSSSLGEIELQSFRRRNRGGGVMVCGSPYEEAPDPTLEDHFEVNDVRSRTVLNYYDEQKQTVWTMLALEAPDQLRQRMALALSQIMTIATNIIVDSPNTEANIYHYDMNVRHAFGNYRSFLKEVGLSPKMGELLTFVKSKSVRFNWDSSQVLNFPDENFARELMQLFTIGLHKLKPNGTPELDKHGEKQPTYDNKDILTFARAWTGYFYSLRRGNTEDLDHSTHSRMDPMTLNVAQHDFFPKTNLYDGWVGDRYPLCSDLPEKAFLRKGAVYKLLGGTSNPSLLFERIEFDANVEAKKVVLLKGESQLYNILCNPYNGICNPEPFVKLDQNYHNPCSGAECHVDILRVVQVEPGLFYEYIQEPCVHYTFYNNAKKVVGRGVDYDMCADPKLPVATRHCCGIGTANRNYANYGKRHAEAEYHGELVKYATNENSCTELGGFVCDPVAIYWCGLPFCNFDRVDITAPEHNVWHWTNNTCSLQLKVRNDGFAAIVHSPSKEFLGPSDARKAGETIPFVHVNKTVNYINIPWHTDPYTLEMVYPTKDNDCGNYSCRLLPDDTCLCDTTMREDIVFDKMPSRESVLSRLHIGFYEPAIFDSGKWVLRNNTDGVALYIDSESPDDFSTQSIFETTNEQGKKIYLKNLESVVTVGGAYEIRNPVNFADLSDIQLRDAQNEIDAVFDHLVYHDNTPPFISTQLIQHFGISNPSPRFVQAVATAFKTGFFKWNDGNNNRFIGDGEWGNLAATAAAIALDRESLSATLDADPTYGSLREPILKVIGFMRSMEYSRTAQDRLIYPKLYNMQGKIGQMVYDSPDQFSFFRPDFTPPGAFSKAALLAPEAQVLTMAYTVGILNGLFSLCRNGLISWSSGFGPNIWSEDGKDNFVEDYNYSVGYLSYTQDPNYSANDTIDELSTLLTSGRLGEESKQYIKNIYDQWNSAGKSGIARISAQQLIATTPEFHGTNILKLTGEARKVTGKTPPANVPYKAVVYLQLFGGLDSFNVLAPYDDTCALYNEYREERGAVGLTTAEMDPIDALGSNQTCTTFGVHKQLKSLRDIYVEGKGVFIANIGHLSKPVTKNNYATETNTDLFSHNTMEEEAFAVDAFKEKSGTGVLGRILDKLDANGLSVGPISIDTKLAMLAGDPRTGRTIDVIPRNGPQTIIDKNFENNGFGQNDMVSHMANLNKGTELNSGFFGDYWSQNLIDVMNKSQELVNVLPVNNPWAGGHGVQEQLKMVAKLILANQQRGVNRDAFVVKMGGFDHHNNLKANMNHLLPQLNTAIQKFKQVLDAEEMLDNVVFVLGSEFGRTITPNTDGGTDHAWGGNIFMFGGGVNGKRILGEYPESFKADDPTNIGRGRLVPTTSWDALWYGISLWFGIKQGDDMEYVLPNSVNFGCKLFSDKDLFVDGTNSIKGCGGKTYSVTVGLFIDSPRYLTGKEQKQMCSKAIERLPGEVSSTRCVIIDTKIIVFTGENGSRRLEGSNITYLAQGDALLTLEPGSNITGGDVVDAFQTAADELAQNSVGATGETTQAELPDEPNPVSSPSTGPSGSTLPDDPYIAEFVNSSLAFNGSTNVIELQVISGTSGTTNLTLWAVDRNANADETMCGNVDGSNEADNILLRPNPQVLQNGTSSELLAYDIELNLTGVERSNIFYNTTETTGEIKFCARVDKYVNSLIGSVSFAETLVTIAVNMTAGIKLFVDGINRENPNELDMDVSYSVDPCICDDSFGCIASVLEKNSEFNLCLSPGTDGLRIDSVNDVDMYQGVVNKFSPVNGGVYNSLSSINFSPDNINAMVKTRVITAFFDAANPPDISIVGSVKLGFDDTSRRVLEKINDAKTEETDVSYAPFKLMVALEPLSDAQGSFTAEEDEEEGNPVVDGQVRDDINANRNSAENEVKVSVIVVVAVAILCSALAFAIFDYRSRRASSVLLK